MAAPVNLYGPPQFTSVSRVLACLLEKDVPFHLLPLDIPRGQHKTIHFLKIQPFGQVPAFQDESITLFESRSIARYVCDKYANQGTKGLFGTNLLERASIDQWLEAEGQSFNPPSAVLIYQVVFGEKLKIERDEELIKQNEAKLAKVLDVYDKRLGESRYLAGDDFTLADLSHLPNMQYLCGTDVWELFRSRKNVERWWNEISNRESWKKVVEMQSPPPPKGVET